MTVQMGVPLPVMCEPKGSMVMQSIMSNVAFCADAKLHNTVSKAETWLNFRRSDFFTKTSAKAIGLLNLVLCRNLTRAPILASFSPMQIGLSRSRRCGNVGTRV